MTISILNLMALFAGFMLFTGCKGESTSPEPTPISEPAGCCGFAQNGIYAIEEPALIREDTALPGLEIRQGNLSVSIHREEGLSMGNSGHKLVLQKRGDLNIQDEEADSQKEHYISPFVDPDGLKRAQNIDAILEGDNKLKYFLVVSYASASDGVADPKSPSTHQIKILEISEDLESIKITDFNNLEAGVVERLPWDCKAEESDISFSTVALSQSYQGDYFVVGNLQVLGSCAGPNSAKKRAMIIKLDEQGETVGPFEIENFDAERFAFVSVIHDENDTFAILSDNTSGATSIAKFAFNSDDSKLTFSETSSKDGGITLEHDKYESFEIKDLVPGNAIYLTGLAYPKNAPEESQMFIAAIDFKGNLTKINQHTQESIMFYKHPESNGTSRAVGERLSLSVKKDGTYLDVYGYVWEGSVVKSLWSQRVFGL